MNWPTKDVYHPPQESTKSTMIHNLYTKELFKLEVLKTATGWQELSQAKLLPLEPKSGTLQELLQQVLQALEDRNAWELFFFNPPGNQPKHFGR